MRIACERQWKVRSDDRAAGGHADLDRSGRDRSAAWFHGPERDRTNRAEAKSTFGSRLRLSWTPRRSDPQRRRTDPNPARSQRRIGVERQRAAADRDAGKIESLFCLTAINPLGENIDEHQMVVGASGYNAEPALSDSAAIVANNLTHICFELVRRPVLPKNAKFQPQ